MIPAVCWAHNEILTLIFALKTQNFSFFVNAFRKLRFRWKKHRMDFAPVSVKKRFGQPGYDQNYLTPQVWASPPSPRKISCT